MDKTNLSKKAGLLMAGCLITLNAFGQATAFKVIKHPAISRPAFFDKFVLSIIY